MNRILRTLCKYLVSCKTPCYNIPRKNHRTRNKPCVLLTHPPAPAPLLTFQTQHPTSVSLHCNLQHVKCLRLIVLPTKCLCNHEHLNPLEDLLEEATCPTFTHHPIHPPTCRRHSHHNNIYNE